MYDPINSDGTLMPLASTLSILERRPAHSERSHADTHHSIDLHLLPQQVDTHRRHDRSGRGRRAKRSPVWQDSGLAYRGLDLGACVRGAGLAQKYPPARPPPVFGGNGAVVPPAVNCTASKANAAPMNIPEKDITHPIPKLFIDSSVTGSIRPLLRRLILGFHRFRSPDAHQPQRSGERQLGRGDEPDRAR